MRGIRINFIGKIINNFTVSKEFYQGKICYVECLCNCGNSFIIRRERLIATESKLPKSCGCLIRENLTGLKFNRWEVLSLSETGTRVAWLCKCECGIEKVVGTHQLKSGKSKSCGCFAAEQVSKRRFNGIGNFSGQAWANIRQDAQKRDLDFNITLQEALDIFHNQQGVCPYTGKLMNLGTLENSNYDRTASLDRIENSKGYSVENCEWIIRPLNQMKRCLTKEQFIALSYLCNNPLINCSSPEQTFHKNLKRNMKIAWRRKGHSIDCDFVYNLLKSQKFCCNITGLPLYLPKSAEEVTSHKCTASLDRIDSKIGYHAGNLQWVHRDINFMKRQFSMDEFKQICKNIASYCCFKSDE